jgi:MFS family permease
VKTFAQECFTHRFYWYFFLASTCRYLALGITTAFVLLRDTNSLGLSLAQLGALTAWTQFVSLLLQYPCGWLADKWNPIRVHVASSFLGIVGTLASCVWLFRDFGVAGNLHYYYWISLIFLPINAICNAAELPMYMRVLPKQRYGQFCSANAMIRAFAMIIGSVLLGVLMKMLGDVVHMDAWRYRYVIVWILAFQIPSSIFLWFLYREWKARGGNHGYTPPVVN